MRKCVCFGLIVSLLALCTGCNHKREADVLPSPQVAAERFVASLARREFNKATEDFDQTMKKALPAERLGGIWRSLVAENGSFVSQIGVRTKSQGRFRSVFVSCRFEKAIVEFKVVFNESGRISGFWLVRVSPLDAQRFEALARKFVALLVKGDFLAATKRFDETMRDALPQERLAQTWENLLARFGPFQRELSASASKKGEYVVVILKSQFESGVVNVKVVYDKAGRVSGLWFAPA